MFIKNGAYDLGRGRKMKTIGILGGMGPYATIDIFKKIIDLSPIKTIGIISI